MGTTRTPEQVADEMCSEMRCRFGFQTPEIVRSWLAQCIAEVRHELAVDMMRASGPPHAVERTPKTP